MKRVTFALKGLNCPNCAAHIENEVSALSYVHKAKINLMAESINIDLASGEETIEEELIAIVKRHEPSVSVQKIVQKQEADGEEEEDQKKEWLVLALGAVLLVLAMIVSRFYPSLSLPLYLAAYLVSGGEVLLNAVRGMIGGDMMDENFLMAVATIGAFAIGENIEAVVVMLLYRVGEGFQDAAVRRARRSIRALSKLRPDTARVIKDGQTISVPPESVEVGDLVQVLPGERVPLDGVVKEGASALDLSMLTGESVPRAIQAGDEAPSGAVNKGSPFIMTATRPADQSTAERIIQMVENAAENKAPAENFITAFSRWYTPAVVGMAVLLAAVPPLLFQAPFALWLKRALVFLVISCPCALVISVPLSYFSAISLAGRQGVMIKGSNYLDVLGKASQVIFDKTGTLTHGQFEVHELRPVQGVSEEKLLKTAAHAENYANHPVATAIKRAFPDVTIENVSGFEEVAGRGVTANVDGHPVMVGSAKWFREQGIEAETFEEAGVVVCVAEDNKLLGYIFCRDALKKSAAPAAKRLRELGIQSLFVFTGDSAENSEEAGQAIKADQVCAGLLPEDKLNKLLTVKQNGITAFVGDGINDAPVLAAADVGVAMGALGADAAVEAADVVLLGDDMEKLPEAVDIARRTRRIVKQNITFALAVKAVTLLLGALGLAGMWEAVFADVGVSMLASLNALRLLLKDLHSVH